MKKNLFAFCITLALLFLSACGYRTVTITFDSQGGSEVNAVSVTQLGSITEPVTTRTGYEFMGWYSDSAFETLFAFETGSARNITLYAKWQINQYTLTFEPDNGASIDPITADYQSVLTIPDDLTKEGYTFSGWYTDPERIDRFEASRMQAADLTLYAKWSPIYYTVEFYVGEDLLTTKQVQHGFTIANLPAVPLQTGYIGSWDFDPDLPVTDNFTAVAQYEIKTYRVTFVDQWDHVYHTATVNHGDSVSEPDTTPEKEGYSFAGYSEIIDELQVTEDMVIEVLFTPITFTVIFRVQGVQVKSDTVLYGTASTPPVVEIPGYTFVGWDQDFDDVRADIDEVNAILTPNSYQIILQGNGGFFEDAEMYTINGDYQSSITYDGRPTRLGYSFSGWYSNADGTGTKVNLVSYTMPLDGKTLYAKWETVSYSITYYNLFEAQNGNSRSYNVTQAITLTNPTSRSGYTFVGWFDQETGGSQVTGISSGSTGDKVLFARWDSNSYDITYLNLFETTHLNPASYTIETATITLTDPTARAGYTFVGWFSDESGGTEVTEITMGSTGNTNLYAKWTTNNYLISYENLQGSTTDNPTSFTIETPTITLTAPDTRVGYNFMGWFNAASGGIEITEIVAGSTADFNLFAGWSANSYLITFNVNGGEALSPLTVTYDQSFILPEPTLEGYTFAGWTCDGESIDDGTWSIASDIIVDALWTEWAVVNFESNGGTPVMSISQAPDSLIAEPANPTRAGYTFGGWYGDSALTSEYEFVTMPSESISVYAKWTADNYSISFENLQGTTTTNPTGYTTETATFTLLNPTARTGYTFTGWYTELAGGTKLTEITKGSTGNKNLYARWTANTYTITFSIDGVLSYLYLPFDSTIAAEAVPTIPTKANYDLTTPYWNQNPVDHLVSGNHTFTAVYVGNPMTVSYDTGGGSLLDPDIVNYGSLSVKPESPTRAGYAFLGWYADSELAVLYDWYDNVNADITLYAAWELQFYTWNIESLFLREDLLDPNTVGDDPDQADILFQYQNLYYGMEVSPIQEYEGYVFDYFSYNGVEYTNIEELIIVEGDLSYEDRIQVFYRRIVLTITFSQNPDYFPVTPEDPEQPIASFRVYYNGTFAISDAPALRGEEAGVTHVIWDRTLFDNVRSDITVYALYYLTGVKTVTFVDRDVIKFIASAIDDLGNPVTGVIGSDSLLWQLHRPGYKFLGWFTAEVGGSAIPQGDLLFADFGSGMTSLYAQWEELTPFNAPANLFVEATESEIIVSWEISPATINLLSPAGFAYILNNRLIEDLTTTPVRAGDTFTLTLLADNPEFALFADLLDPGYHKLRIKALGDDQNHYDSEYSEDYIFALESIFDGDPTEVAVYDYFIIETYGATKRYIFYTNLEYQFGSGYSFEIVTGQEFVTAEQNRITTRNMSGSFKFRMIREGYPTVVYDALVVHDIKQFTYGANYQNYLQATDPEQNVLLKEATGYYVGSGSNFYVDLRMINNQGARIPLAQSILDFDLYQDVSGNYQLISENDLDDYVEFFQNNEMKFTGLAEGKTFKLVVKPKYQANGMTVALLEYVFTVNDGVNVFSNQQLKTYYSDFDVTTINIHASFKAELASAQKNADGSPKNYRPSAPGQATGNVYQRYSTTLDDDQLRIEGNYMTIDGSELPFNNAGSGSGTIGFAQSFEIINVQVSIFYYSVNNTALGATNNNSFSMNNLILKGNTSTPYVDFSGTAEEIEIQERLMSRNSGGYGGVIVANGASSFTNMFVFNTVIAITNNAYGYTSSMEPTYVIIDYMKTDSNWANTFYLHAGHGWIISNSEIGQSGGSAIHMVDYRPAVFDEFGEKISNPTPYLELDDSTTINNWISGEEAWFKAYGMSQVALTLKSGIENGISGTGRSVISLITDPLSGLETEMINFVLLTEPSSAADVYQDPEELNQIGGSEVSLKLEGFQIDRPFNFFTVNVDDTYFPFPDPRISDGQFAFPVGAYSEFPDFYQLIVDLRGLGVSEADSSNLATLGAFYGLTAQETVNTMGYAMMNSITFKAALAYTVPGKVYPKFIEVLAPVPVFPSGYSSVIIQFNDGE